ncbi:MAG TPA: amidohydrolase family protein [candidate division Zixibacteria bacterium]|nr:amidohydrolase family protein [candidate division Zixibacteria bacterium]
MFTLDIHCHFFPQAFLDEARKRDNPFQASIELGSSGQEYLICTGDFRHPLTPDFYDADRLIHDMDDRKVRMSAVSAAPPTLSYWADAPSACDLASRMNDSIAQRVTAYPDRFLGLATVPLQDVDTSIQEARRAIKELGLHGFQIGSNVNGRNLNHPELFPFFAAVAELGVPLFIHPYIPAGAERMQDYYLHNLVGMVAETGLAIASIIFGGIVERLPELKICFAHAGGVFPYIVGRHDHGYLVREQECRQAIPHPPSYYLPALHFDAITFHPLALRYLVDLVGTDQVIIGSDYPFDMGPVQPVDTILKNPTLTEEEKRKICGQNAAALFSLKIMN